jgi:hypothetical protein
MSESSTIRGLVAQPPLHPASFDRLNPSRFDHLYLYYQGDEKGDDQKQRYRYRLTIVDRALLPTTNVAFSTAVFLIPAGREAEYMFSSQKGLVAIAESANCARLIAVAFGRTSSFLDQEFVQKELTYVVQILSRQGNFLPSFLQKKFADKTTNIPFMASDGIGSRNVLAKGETTMSGDYLVEQVKVDGQWMRRLYFMDNPFVIQSEVSMKDDDEDEVDKSILAFDYHKSIVAGLASLATDLTEINSACVIGLGGGGLVNFLQHAAPKVQVTVVELDPSVAEVAEMFFGFEPNDDSARVVIGDGLEVNIKAEAVTADLGFLPQSLSFLVIDADSKDKTVGMSCPPAAFCTVEYLNTLKAILKPQGSVLAINVSARDPEMANMVFRNVQSVFGSVFVVSSDDDDDDDEEEQDEKEKSVNVALLATPQKTKVPTSEEMASRIDLLCAKTVGAELLSDLRACDVTEWANRKSKKAGGGGSKKKQNKKKGKKGRRK